MDEGTVTYKPQNILELTNYCKADRDGDCNWGACPQLRDKEPEATGRSCPIEPWNDEDYYGV